MSTSATTTQDASKVPTQQTRCYILELPAELLTAICESTLDLSKGPPTVTIDLIFPGGNITKDAPLRSPLARTCKTFYRESQDMAKRCQLLIEVPIYGNYVPRDLLAQYRIRLRSTMNRLLNHRFLSLPWKSVRVDLHNTLSDLRHGWYINASFIRKFQRLVPGTVFNFRFPKISRSRPNLYFRVTSWEAVGKGMAEGLSADVESSSDVDSSKRTTANIAQRWLECEEMA